MAESVTDALELARANSDWILKQAKELNALLGYNSREMLVSNRGRALAAIDTTMDSLKELKGNLMEIVEIPLSETLQRAYEKSAEHNGTKGSRVSELEKE